MGNGKINGHARQRELGDALAAFLEQQAGAERYRRRQQHVRGGRTGSVDRPRPLEFDENGFPVAQPTGSFVTRVTRS